MDESFCFSVGSGGVGSGEAVPDILLCEQRAEASIAVAGSVVGEYAADGEAEAGEVGSAHVEEELCRGAGLIRQDGGEADAAVVVDGDVHVLVACAGNVVAGIAGDAMAGTHDTRQSLDVEVNEVARTGVFVTHHRWRRVERTQPVHAGPAQDAAHRCPAQAQCLGDPPAVVAQAAKSQNPFQ